MDLGGTQILDSLYAAKWDTAFRTYGNNHSTLIGLIVDWWVSGNPDRRWALEAGPTNGCKEKGERGQCDALLCLDENQVGVLEVEGSRHEFTVRKIGTFFDGKNSKITSLRFALLLFYTCTPRGRGIQRAFPSPFSSHFVEKLKIISGRHPDKPIILISLEKRYDRTTTGIRASNMYYMAEPYEISIRLYENGSEAVCHHIDKPANRVHPIAETAGSG